MVEEPKISFFSYLKITVNTLRDLMLEKELFSKTKNTVTLICILSALPDIGLHGGELARPPCGRVGLWLKDTRALQGRIGP